MFREQRCLCGPKPKEDVPTLAVLKAEALRTQVVAVRIIDAGWPAEASLSHSKPKLMSQLPGLPHGAVVLKVERNLDDFPASWSEDVSPIPGSLPIPGPRIAAARTVPSPAEAREVFTHADESSGSGSTQQVVKS